MRSISLLLALRHRRPPCSRRRRRRRRKSRAANPSAGPTRAAARSKRARRFAPSTSPSTTSSIRTIPTRTRRSIAGRTAFTCSRARASSRTSCCSRRATRSSRGCSTSRRARCARAASSPRPSVEPGSYDAATNSVDINVHVRDSWSLALDLKLNRSGGQTEWGIGLSDENLFGTGKTLEVAYESEIDRDQATARLLRRQRVRQPRAACGPVRERQRRPPPPARTSSGRSSRSTHAWSVGGSIHDEERVDTMYDLGEEIDEFGHDIDASSVQGGWSRGVVEQRRAALAVRRRVGGAHVPRRRSTSRSRCCCRRTASSSIRGSAGNGSRTTTAR